MTAHCETEPLHRRDVLAGAAGLLASAGGAAALWPLLDQMNPNPATPLPPVTDVDLARVGPGQEVTVAWKNKPVIIRHRTESELAAARATPLAALRDPLARNAARPEHALAVDHNRTEAGHEPWLVVVGLCTHLGCRLLSNPDPAGSLEGAAWFCPCHASRFDTSGRVRSGPALTNLPVPPLTWLGPERIRIG